MISVHDALNHLFSLARVMETETVDLSRANGRVLRAPVVALRDQPPFASSAMDGYAITDADFRIGAVLDVIGESAAGHRFDGTLAQGQAVRIFTGAPIPSGADYVVIQEDIDRSSSKITITDRLGTGTNIRPAGSDFKNGETVRAPRIIVPKDIALIAAMNAGTVTVSRKPVIALISTGDELVFPGDAPNDDQIIASNTFGLAALFQNAGADTRILPIARDNMASLNAAFDLAADADVIITIGGASVGDHDLVARAASERGVEQAFYKVAMRPGKPLMAGKLGDTAIIGLPGNPVSAMVCGMIFIVPMIHAMLGLPAAPARRFSARLTHTLDANGPREHYMRAHVDNGEITLAPRQDSALLSVLSTANALAIHPPHAPTSAVGDVIDYIVL